MTSNEIRRAYLDSGAVVLATSEEPEVRLGSYLIRRGTLPEEAVHSAEDRLAGDSIRLGQVLLRLELVDQPTLEAAVSEQVRAILWGAFEWDSGEVLFEVGSRPEDSPVRLDLSIPELVVGGVRRAHSVRRFVDRLGSGHSVLERTTTDVPASLFDNGESDFLDLVDGRTPVKVLCPGARGPRRSSEPHRASVASLTSSTTPKVAISCSNSGAP